jgi:hypothetical protein
LLFDTKQAGRGFVADRGFASIGYGVPGGIGSQIGVGDKRRVVALTGDGGFNMTMGEMETAKRLGANFVLCVFNNAASGYVKALQHSVYGAGNYQSSDLHELNYAEIATHLGCLGIRVDDPDKVADALAQGLANTSSPTIIGRYLLVPQGSRLVGRYDSQVAFGQRRVLLVWTRLILPDTSSIALDRLPGIDPAGYAGLEDGVDWHWGRILAGAALSTLLGVGVELAAPDRLAGDSSGGNRVGGAARQGVQDTVNDVGQEITKRNASIQPTLTIRPGFPMRVMVNKDLILRPYQPLFFVRGVPP